MKIKLLVAAIAVAAVPFSAQADLKIGGDFTVGYISEGNGTESFGDLGSEVNFDASAEANGLSYFGHAELDLGNSGTNPRFDELRVGLKGGFGVLTIGDVDDACDGNDFGGNGTITSYNTAGTLAGCNGSLDQSNIRYDGSAGATSYSISYSPKSTSATHGHADNTAIGLKHSFGAMGVFLGHQTTNSRTVLGLSADMGKVALGLQLADDDTQADPSWNVRASTTVGNGLFLFAEHGDNNGATATAAGIAKSLGGGTSLLVEVEDESVNADTRYTVGLKHNF